MSRPAAFLDRDGTIIDDVGFIGKPEQIAILPGALEALQLLERSGIARIVISNQSGVARGLFREADVDAVNAALAAELAAGGASVDAFYYCPHLDDGCDCRKPLPGMAKRAAREHDLDVAASVVIGDRGADIGVAQALGIPGILIASERYPYQGPEPAARVPSLLDAVRWTLDRVRA